MSSTQCEECGHGNQLGSQFCSSCGQPLGVRASDETAALEEHELAGLQGAPTRGDRVPGPGVLEVSDGPKAGSRFELSDDVTTVGRHPESRIFLDDITVSRRHVEITTAGDGYRVRDVGSLNGTYLNQQRVEEADLHNGDLLQVGRFKFHFHLEPSSTAS
ncbi:MAG: FHA domain-containing protein [Actinomycetia bacterium]|nr:FHA domain-containing protein [Actinomycetes bacterium]